MVQDVVTESMAPGQAKAPLVYVILGVSASGKSTVGIKLAERFGCQFFEGDDYHPQANIDKMKSGQPLTDEDRLPWLKKLAEIITKQVNEKQLAVMSCSALKRSYRDILREHTDAVCSLDGNCEPDVAFVLLDPSRAELDRRFKQREREGKHFMPAKLLDSQLLTLERGRRYAQRLGAKLGMTAEPEVGAGSSAAATSAASGAAEKQAGGPGKLAKEQLKELEEGDEDEFYMHIEDGAHDGTGDPHKGQAAGAGNGACTLRGCKAEDRTPLAPKPECTAPFPDTDTIVNLIVARRQVK